MSKSILLAFAGALFALVISSTSGQTPQQPAPATPAQKPGSAGLPAATQAPAVDQSKALGPMPADMKNPVKATADSQARAKQIYQIDCSMCHGDNGNGKSDLATSMNLTLDDWTDSKALAGKMDGELFDVIRTGKGQMPPEDPARAKDVDVWNLIVYIRAMGKPSASAASSAN